MAPSAQVKEAHEPEALEIQLLLDGIFRQYGYDFRDYALSSITRRIASFLASEGLPTISGLQEKILHDAQAMARLLAHLTTHVNALFRDPNFFLALRNQVIPMLKTYPFLRIWAAGCSTGEEVYSTAIVLKEEGIYDRCRIYATDLSQEVLDKAKEGITPRGLLKGCSTNYREAGGSASLSDYTTADGAQVLLDPSLKANVLFAQHNLVTDSSFNEFHLILCRNVMIYFNQTLRDRVHQLLYKSLCNFGYLALGNEESLKFTAFEPCYEEVGGTTKIYRKVR